MKGQTLFIRAIESSDDESVSDFLKRHGGGSAGSLSGILGKLVGDLVAVLTIEMDEQGIEVRELVVRGDLRRKRIGSLLLDHLEHFAASSGRDNLRVHANDQVRQFFLKVGFSREGDFLVRRVSRCETVSEVRE